jgi:hypothetical protein
MLDTEVTVALQGTLDTFALPDVLRLLSSTKKVGRLRVTGDSGSGSLWVDGGSVVGSELLVRGAEADSLTEALFNLLRFSHGSFTFEAGSLPPVNGEQRDVEGVIVEAELMLGEWRALELVVPSLETWLTLTQELKGRDVVVDGARWRIIVTIGSGATVAEVGRRVGLGELAVMRAVKEMIELGLVEVSDAAPVEIPVAPVELAAPPVAASFTAAPATSTAPVAPAYAAPLAPPVADAAPFEEPPSMVAAEPFGVEVASSSFDTLADDYGDVFSTDETGGSGSESGESSFAEAAVDVPVFTSDTPLVAHSITEMRAGLGAMPLSDEPARRPSTYDTPVGDPSEIARQLANLSPRAAKAVAAAAKATTDEEREAALATIEAEDETINRGLLLKFLGAVDG